LQRILKDLDTFSEIEVVLGLERSDVRPYQLAVARVILSIFTLLTVASGMIYTAEHTVNPAIPDYFTALYFGLTTLTTVGFGDITPITFPGKVVVCASILFGITVIPAQAALLVDTLFEYQKERASELEENADLSEIILIDYDDSDTIFAVDQQGNNKKNSQNGMGMDTNSIDDDVRCHVCSASSHRMDALFCWSCGTRL
jgi:voltage-gated potassium channel Kch